MEWTVGIDWGDEAHQVEVQSEAADETINSEYSACVDGLYQLRDDLLAKTDTPEKLKVGIEDPTRPIVRVLAEVGMEIFILNPQQVDGCRSVYAGSEAKTDELDAHVICEEMRVHRNIFYKLTPTPPVIAALSKYYRARENAKGDIGRFSNRLRDMLREYFPRFLELDWELASRVMLDLLELIPSPSAVEEVSVQQVDKVLGRSRKHSAREVLEILGAQTPPLADRLAESIAEVAQNQAQKLRLSLREESRCAEKIEELLEEIAERQKADDLPSAASCSEKESANSTDETPLSDVEILLSTKGVGIHTAAGMLAEGFEAISGLDREMLRRQSIAPVTEQTGKQSFSGDGPDPFVHQRFARNRPLSQAMHHLGDSLQRQNAHYRARYVKMKDKNHTHGRACRQLADQYLRVLFAMLRDRTTYDPALHGATRRKQTGKKPVKTG